MALDGIPNNLPPEAQAYIRKLEAIITELRSNDKQKTTDIKNLKKRVK